MIKKLLISLFLLVGISVSGATAHPGGHAAINDNQAIALALYVADQLTEFDAGLGFGQLDGSWSNLPEDASTIHVRGAGYYVISVENTYERATLFVLMSESGEVYDANFDGVFEGLE
jgi:hypothetical protein